MVARCNHKSIYSQLFEVLFIRRRKKGKVDKIPPGTYTCELESLKIRKSKADVLTILWKLKIIDGLARGRSLVYKVKRRSK